jgi:hypothetical protein
MPPETTRPEQSTVPTEFKRIPENASADQREFAIVEMAQAYASIAAANMVELPALRTAITEMRAEMAAHRLEIRRVDALAEEVRAKVVVLEVDLRRVTGRVDRMQMEMAEKFSSEMVRTDPSLDALPPMRERFDSSHDDAERVAQMAIQGIEEERANKSTPPPGPEKIKQLIADPVKLALDQVKAGLYDQLQEERKAAETERLAIAREAEAARQQLMLTNAKSKNTTKWAVILAGLLGVGTIIREVIEHYLQHH